MTGENPEQVSQEALARVVRDHAGRLAAVPGLAARRLLGGGGSRPGRGRDRAAALAGRRGARTGPTRGCSPSPAGAGSTCCAARRTTAPSSPSCTWAEPVPKDDRLRLIFTCCHPALSREAQIALTLRVVCGLSTAQIAAAFLVPETTVAQRLTRAKRKITEAGIPYRIPDGDDLPERLEGALAVIYLLFNEGYLSSGGARAQARDLVDDAEWLASLLAGLMPDEPEVAGLLALIRLHRARGAARFDDREAARAAGRPGPRPGGTTRRSRAATALLVRAARAHRRPGPYQLQAAIAACHAEAESFESTDWPQIVVLYDMLLHLAPSPITRLHRAIALRYAASPEAALDELKDLDRALDDLSAAPRHPRRPAARAGPQPGGQGGRRAGAGADHQPRPAGTAGRTAELELTGSRRGTYLHDRTLIDVAVLKGVEAEPDGGGGVR